MKTKEFIEKVEKMGFDIAYYKNPYSNEKSIFDYDLITIYLDDQDLVKVWTSCQYAISTISDGHSCYITGYDVKELYKLCFEYVKTPVKDREDKEKKFYLRHKFLCDNAGLSSFDVYLNHRFEDGSYFIYGSGQNKFVKSQFTVKDIEEIKEKFNTDLSDFEMVEVEDEKV